MISAILDAFLVVPLQKSIGARTASLGPGYFIVRWQADVPSGTYIYRLQAGEYVKTKKMMLLR